jgi:DNA-binding CsgD family transcriptional regulator
MLCDHMAGRRGEREWLELFAELMATPLVRLPTELLALRLQETFESTACSYNDVVNSEHRTVELWPDHEQLRGHRQEMTEWVRTRGHQHPLARFYLATGRRVPMQVADTPVEMVVPAAARAWDEIGTAIGCPDQLALPLRLHSGDARAFVLGRPGRYNLADIELATTLWRLLTALDRQVATLRSVAVSSVADYGARDAAGLTPRETAVLALLGDGLTAKAIASRLTISERTVHKHLERIYVKLDVADRLAAVLRAKEWGLLPRDLTGGPPVSARGGR